MGNCCCIPKTKEYIIESCYNSKDCKYSYEITNLISKDDSQESPDPE